MSRVLFIRSKFPDDDALPLKQKCRRRPSNEIFFSFISGHTQAYFVYLKRLELVKIFRKPSRGICQFLGADVGFDRRRRKKTDVLVRVGIYFPLKSSSLPLPPGRKRSEIMIGVFLLAN